MKKKIIALSVALILCITISGTLAFSTATKNDENILATSRVEIKQYEYEREKDSNGYFTTTLKFFNQGKNIEPAYYAEGQKKYSTDYQSWKSVGVDSQNKLYDQSIKNVIDKMVFVKNTGNTNLYYRTIIAFECPEEFDYSLINFNINESDKFKWDDIGYAYISGTRYYLKVATYKESLEPGEVSIPSLLQVFLDPKTNNKDMELLGKTFDILVKTQASQSFNDVESEKALNDAFGNIEDNLPWDDVIIPCIIETETQLREFLRVGGSCVLSKDITISGDLNGGWNVLPPIKNETILNFNGHTITNDTTTSNNFNMALVGSSSGKLTIRGNGKVEFTTDKKSNGSSAVIYATASSNITIEDGTYESDGSKYNIAVWAQDNSVVIINDGTFKNNNEVSDLIYATGNATIYIKGGFFESASASKNDTLNIMGGANAKIIVSGGTFVNDDPSIEDGDDEGKVIIEDGYKVVSETQTNGEVWYKVVPE